MLVAASVAWLGKVMRYFAISGLVLLLSCSSDGPSPVDVTGGVEEMPLVALGSPGEIVLTSRTDRPVAYFVHAQASTVSVRWPRCDSPVAVQLPNILAPHSELHLPAGQISGYQIGDTAVVHYKVVLRYTRISSAQFYYCLKEGRIVVTLQ
jgi:hypothetical protein